MPIVYRYHKLHNVVSQILNQYFLYILLFFYFFDKTLKRMTHIIILTSYYQRRDRTMFMTYTYNIYKVNSNYLILRFMNSKLYVLKKSKKYVHCAN